MALCVDAESARNPGLIGLDGEQLEAQEWLDVFTTGAEAREGIAGNDDLEEAWVLSCDDVEPINLAASIKSDCQGRNVRLVTADACGSLFSRAHTARIDEVLELAAFPRRYAEAKGSLAPTPSGDSGEGGAGAAETRALLAPAPVAEEVVVLDPPKTAAPPARFLGLQPLAQPVAAPSGNHAFVLTVVSGSGGAGKSSVAALSAVAFQARGYRTLLLDCDLQFGDVAAMVGEKEPVCLDEVLLRPDRLESDVVREGALSVLAAPSRLEASEEAVRRLPDLLGRLTSLFEVIVVNTGASWAEQHAVLLERSSVALFLVDQRVSSVRACRHALELCARCGIAANPFQFALNRCAKGAPLTSADVSAALQGASVYELKDGGRDVEDYLSAGAADNLIEMRNEFARSVENVVDCLLPAGDRRPAGFAAGAGERRPPRGRARRAPWKRGEN